MFLFDFLKSQDMSGMNLIIMQPFLNLERLISATVNVILSSTITHVRIDDVAFGNIKLEGST